MSDPSAPRAHIRTPQTDEVLRRIGRNVINFQHVEYLLKHLNAHASVHAPASQLSARLEKQMASVHKSTMGELAGRMVSNVLQPQPEHKTPDEIDEPWFGYRFSIGADAGFVYRHDQEMRALVDARNDLIHHFLPRWQSAVGGDTESALAYLDAQMNETLRMKERLESWARGMDEAKGRLATFLTSPRGARQMELVFLKGSRLVAMLGEIAMHTARPDGWVLLSTAGDSIKREAPTELSNLQKRFGHRSLKGVLLAVEFFEVAEESLPGGGTRTIYRINDRYELQLRSEWPQGSPSDGVVG